MKRHKVNFALFVFFGLLSFPLFYYVYKYGSPFLGMIDFFDYYKLYKNMDFSAADSPLNMRLVSSFFVYCLNKAGLAYDTQTQIDNAPFDKTIFFNAVFFNYLSVIFTCILIFHIVRKWNTIILSLLAGLLYLLGFGTIFFEMMPLADAFGVLLFAVALWFYYKQSHLILIPLTLLIFQREYIFLALGLVGLLDYIRYRQKYYIFTLVYCIICFGIYVLLRKLIFETPRYSHHTSVEFMFNSLFKLNFPLFTFIKQTLMTMNVFIIYLLIIGYKWIRQIEFNRYEFIKIMFLLLQILILTFLLALGNNAGRYFYMLMPLIVLNIINEVKTFKLESV